MADLISLRDMPTGETRIIAGIRAGGEMGRRIRDMGLVPGVAITLLGRAPLRDPITVQLRGGVITLRNNEADQITLRHMEVV